MRKSRAGRQTGDKLVDHISLTKVNYILYVFIVILTIVILYFVVVEYLIYTGQRPRADLEAELTRNDVERFSDGMHPFIVVTTAAKKNSVIQVMLTSADYGAQYSSGDYVINYTAFVLLPSDAFATDFNVTVRALDEKGRVKTTGFPFTTQEKPDVLFKVQ